MSQIHILDGQSNQGEILDYITGKDIISDNHKKSKEDTLETFDFITFADKRFSEFLEKRNRLIVPDEDDTLREFVIFEAAKYKDTEGYKFQVFSHATYLELKKASILYPDGGYQGTASQHGGRALDKTGWQMGIVEGKGILTLTIEEHTNPYKQLKKIAKEFELELRFRVEHDGNKITGRYVDMLERIGEWRGREVEFGKDLDGIRRIEKQDIVTALLGIGPEDEDGNRLEVLVEDEDALKRWGRVDEYGELHHLIEPYEIESTRTEMTEEEAIRYTRTALNKRINTQVTYETTIVDLENVPGMQNKKIRFGDTIRIKDTKFNPPLYLEARIFEQNRSIKSKAKKDVKLGDYIEYTEEEVHDIWNQLRKDIQKRVTAAEMAEYTYNKLTIDNKDEQVYKDGKSFTEATGVEAKEYADEQDKKVKADVEDYTDKKAAEEADSALSSAKQYAVAKEVYEKEMDKIASDIEDRAPLEYVDGEFKIVKDDLEKFEVDIEEKADKSTTYTIKDVDNMINNTVSVTEYEEDMDGIVSDIKSHGTRIGQNAEAIGLKADKSYVDDENDSLQTKIGEIEITADEAKISVSDLKTEVEDIDEDIDDLTGQVEKNTTDITANAKEISLKASQSVVDSIENKAETLEADFKVQAEKIEGKISSKDAESIFLQEADKFTFDADQINFKGHVFGKDAEFEGDITGAKITGSTLIQSNDTGEMIIDSDGIKFKDEDDGLRLALLNEGVDGNHGGINGIYLYNGGKDPSFYMSQYYTDTEIWANNRLNIVSEELGVHIETKKSATGFSLYLQGGGLSLPDRGSLGGVEFADKHSISSSPSEGNFTFYGNRIGGQRPFAIRSHENKASGSGNNSYRTDMFIGGSSGAIYAPRTYKQTSSNSANMRIGASGQMYRTTSADKYKVLVEDINFDYNKIMDLFPKHWYDMEECDRLAYLNDKRYKDEEPDEDIAVSPIKRIAGLSANDVYDVGLGIYCEYNEDGEVEGLQYDRLLTLLIPVVRDLKKDVEELKNDRK